MERFSTPEKRRKNEKVRKMVKIKYINTVSKILAEKVKNVRMEELKVMETITYFEKEAEQLEAKARTLRNMADIIRIYTSDSWSLVYEVAQKHLKKNNIKTPFWDWVYGVTEDEWVKI